MKMKWKKLFKPHILDRGMEYYCASCVESLVVDEEKITAVVQGTEDYDVLIELDKGKVPDMECTCPYAGNARRREGRRGNRRGLARPV